MTFQPVQTMKPQDWALRVAKPLQRHEEVCFVMAGIGEIRRRKDGRGVGERMEQRETVSHSLGSCSGHPTRDEDILSKLWLHKPRKHPKPKTVYPQEETPASFTPLHSVLLRRVLRTRHLPALHLGAGARHVCHQTPPSANSQPTHSLSQGKKNDEKQTYPSSAAAS